MSQIVAGVEKLRLKFTGSSSLLFKDVSSLIYAGEKVLILGPSGCGKSTLLQILSGLIPHSIEAPMKAESVTVPRSWGYVFQDPDTQYCMPYVDEEIAFVLENLRVPRHEMPALIRKYVEMVGLAIEDMHTSIQSLSGGMKQRLSIASVMALQPEVLFLDEPTAMLDPEGTEQVWETIKEVAQDQTVLIVEHKIEHVLDFIERIILFNEQGEIIADGPKDQILSAHKQQLIAQGIWYPGVWEDYVHRAQRQSYIDLQHKYHQNEWMLSISDFKGFRGNDIKLHVEQAQLFPGEWIAIVGKNGAGKSTLLHSLMQLIKTTGEYMIEKQPIVEIDKLTDHLTFVFQNPEFQFVTNSVYDEIAYSLRIDEMGEQQIEEIVNRLIAQFRLLGQTEQHPYQLSMGQKRRLSVAAAIVKEQKIILLDEPTFGQDAKNTFAILELIEHWRKQGTIVLMATHSMEVVQYFSNRVWLIENGKLEFDGTSAQYREKYLQQPLLNSR
ncbi:ABC transporter ATP-binding protein [Chengkuizengella sediminis]|uniref:ABC transporter ATP-binding protein n=1 Tax=Chengkuizengella sediminis TaxID=1885917 RepID=UPI001F0DD978|nr:ABC transporter ATP-binding protein [Chengkuizengella sediminis]